MILKFANILIEDCLEHNFVMPIVYILTFSLQLHVQTYV